MTFDDVRALALALPRVEEGPCWGTPAFRIRGRLLARLKEDGVTMMLKVHDRREREALLLGEGDTFFTTPHYANYPAVLVRLESVDPGELHELLIEAWREAAPKRLLATWDAEHPPPAAED